MAPSVQLLRASLFISHHGRRHHGGAHVRRIDGRARQEVREIQGARLNVL
jgi:hypothetical protein